MKTNSYLLGAVLLAVGCGAPTDTAIDLNVSLDGVNPDSFANAFFGRAFVFGKPLFGSEDLNANGVLDANEDANGNGVIDEILLDLNQDGAANEDDIATFSVFSLVASSGETNCATFTQQIEENNGVFLFQGEVFSLVGIQRDLGAVGNLFVEGNTLTNRNAGALAQTSFEIVLGNFDNDRPINNAIALGEEGVSLTLDALGDALDARLSAPLKNSAFEDVPLTLEAVNVRECDAFSAFLQGLAEAGEFR